MSDEARALRTIGEMNRAIPPALDRLADSTDANTALLTARLPAGGASTEATLALIKAKTDNLDVALSTRTKPADAQHAIIDSGAVTVTGVATDAKLDTIIAKLAHSTRSDTYTTTASGTTVNISSAPCKSFCLQINTTGVITLWTVVLETSLDGTNFTTALTHATADLTGTLKVTGATWTPAFYWRTRCTALTLGAGTNVIATGLGMP